MSSIQTEVEFLPIFLQHPAEFGEEFYAAHWIDERAGIQAIFRINKEGNPTVFALLFMRAKSWDKEKASEFLGQHPEFLPKKLAEAIEKQKGKTILRLLRSPMPFINEFYTLRTIDEGDGIYSITGFTADSSVPKVVALIFNGKEWDRAKVNEWLQSRQGDAYKEEW